MTEDLELFLFNTRTIFSSLEIKDQYELDFNYAFGLSLPESTS